MDGMIRIFTGPELTCNLLKSTLAEKGIESIIVNEFNSGLAAGFGVLPSAVEVHIRESDLSKAEPILNDFTNSESVEP